MDLIKKEADIYSKLLILRDKFGCEGIKSEFENEASAFADLIFLRYLTAKAGMKLYVKLGGVEVLQI
jgi:hypothetical protein